MNFAITEITKFAESLKGNINWFDLHFTTISDTERQTLADKFDEIGFEPNPRLTQNAGFIRVAHKSLKTTGEVETLLRENGIAFLP